MKKKHKDTSFEHSESERKNIILASSLSVKSVTLHDWWLIEAEGYNGIAVAGFASRERLGVRAFFSAPISKRIDVTTLETKDGITIVISGLINRLQTFQNGFPFKVCDLFQCGFPYNWEDCVTQCCGEQSGKRNITTTQPGFVELNYSSGANANAFLPFNFDNLSAIRIRDLVMGLPKDSGNLTWDDILGIRGNAPAAAHSKLENGSPNVTANSQVDGTNAKLLHGKGVVTRSKSRNLQSKQQDYLESNSSIEVETNNHLSMSAANKNSATISSRHDEKVAEVPDRFAVRRSGRLQIRKTYTGMAV